MLVAIGVSHHAAVMSCKLRARREAIVQSQAIIAPDDITSAAAATYNAKVVQAPAIKGLPA